MLKNIPPIISPELLSVLNEMGHGDRICIGDGNFPGASMADAEGAILVRADGHGVPELLDAILQLIPLDEMMDTMYAVGKKLPAELRETALGGCAITPSACAACNKCK